MAATFKWTSYNTADTAVAGTSMNALASGGYALGAAIDNRTLLYLYADLTIALSSAVTTGTAAPYLSVYLLPAVDGTNYPSPPGGTAGAAPMSMLAGSYSAVSGVATQFIAVRGIVLPPALFKIMILNGLGVAFPATTTSVCSLYRYGEQSV